MKRIVSKQYSLQARDFIRGVILAAIAPVVTIVQNSLSANELTFNWRLIGITALSAGTAYIAKNFFEPTKTIEIKR